MKKIFAFISLLFFCMNSTAASRCLSIYKQEYVAFNSEQIVDLPSGRRMKVYFDKADGLKDGDEIILAIPGLGRSYRHLKAFTETSLSYGKSVFGLDLQGHGETFKLNPNVSYRTTIPIEYNAEDLVFILKELSKKYKIRIVSHSYGAGVALNAISKLHRAGIQLPITKLILLSSLVKNLDTYYADALMSGQLVQVAGDMANPGLAIMGVSPEWIKMYDSIVNQALFSSNAIPQKARDTMYNMMPMMTMWREWFSAGPNAAANLLLSPAHMIANASYEDIAAWQKNPMLLTQLIVTNIALINGARDHNYLDYSKDLVLPEGLDYKVVMAMNDLVVPNTISQEFAIRMQKAGYKVTTQTLPGETHYYLYDSVSMKKYFKSMVLD